jgi:hypothetical protein
MTKITEKQFIESLSQLKEIKPNKEWASLLKSQILSENKIVSEVPQIEAESVGFMNALSSVFSARKLVYSLAVFLFVIVGILGFSKYIIPDDASKKVAVQTQTSISSQNDLNQEVAILTNKINALAAASKAGKTSNMSDVSAKVSELAKNLKDNPKQNSQTIKEIASSLKTLADVSGADLSSNQDVKDLYQTVVQSQIADLQTMTLTDDQKKTLTEAEDLSSQGKYSDALEKILLINSK